MSPRRAVTPRRLAVNAPVTVSTTAVQLLPENHARVALILHETGGQPARFDTHDDVAATNGVLLAASTQLVWEGDACPTDAIWAIRQGGSDATVVAAEVIA